MALHLVRHALSADRPSWTLDDVLRPLADAGTRQAHVLATSSGIGEGSRVFSSPAQRCIDTVAPLARRRGIEVEIEDLLYEGNGAGVLGALRDAMRTTRGAVVACTHGDVLAALLNALVYEDDLQLPDEVRWQEASTWVIDHDADARATAATYRGLTIA